MTGDKVARIERYATTYEADYDFEAVMVAARQRAVLEFLDRRVPRVVVEVGCGTDLLSARAEDRGLPFDRWVIVEPSSRFAAVAADHAAGSHRVAVVPTFLEDGVGAVADIGGSAADVVVCSSLLHEIPDTRELLGAARALLAPDGCLYVDVPNARSVHRRLARAMGLVAHETDFGARNLAFEQQRVYDAETLRRALEEAGFRPVEEGGYFLKPFTHSQMESLGFLDDKILDGLWSLGHEVPELAAEIFCVAAPR